MCFINRCRLRCRGVSVLRRPAKGFSDPLKPTTRGRSHELEVLPEALSQKADVGLGEVLRLVAVNDNSRRAVAPLVRIAQLDAPTLMQRRSVLLHRAFQHRGELRRWHLRMALSQASATAP